MGQGWLVAGMWETRKKYIQSLGRLETTSECSFKRKDNIKICFEEIRCESKVSIEVAQVRIQRWRRVNKRNNCFSWILCIGSVYEVGLHIFGIGKALPLCYSTWLSAKACFPKLDVFSRNYENILIRTKRRKYRQRQKIFESECYASVYWLSP
jgi:hypothetical protein